jgi:mRNA-degrading endonuclease RelE of RelBE toxin-antitoxin system
VSDYDVDFTPPARRAMARLPEKVAAAIAEFVVGSLAENPRRLSKELKLELAGTYSARRGDYRIVFEVDEELRRVAVVRIEHRADAYRLQGT